MGRPYPCWKVWTCRFWKTVGRVVGVLLRVKIFLHVLVGGDGGVVGPKELVGWIDTVTDGLSFNPPTPRFTQVEE